MGDLTRDKNLHLDVSNNLKKRIRAAAGAEDQSMAQWVRDSLRSAANRTLAEQLLDGEDAEVFDSDDEAEAVANGGR